MRFWLGTHMPNWLELTDVDLFVSHRRLGHRKTLPRARGEWALDSGGFSELSLFGEWRTSESEYADAICRYSEEIGGLVWAAPQDWMCEPFITENTGLSVREHQERTIASVIGLRDRGLPVVPVLQGWERHEYLTHVELYETAGFDLRAEPVVGVGSVCRRQHMDLAVDLFEELAGAGLRMHGFGVKLTALSRCSWALASADSMAWSYRARRAGRQPGCSHKSCANCLRFALAWREQALRASSTVQSPRLFVDRVTPSVSFPSVLGAG